MSSIASANVLSRFNVSTSIKALLAASESTSDRYRDSFGNELSEIGGRCRWVLTGSALKVWLEDVCQRVNEAIQWNESCIYRGLSIREPIIRHCWMMGLDKSYAYPTVVISCQNTNILKKGMRAILKLNFLSERGFKLKGILQCDLRLLAAGDGSQVRLTGIGCGDGLGIPRSLCGAEAVVRGSNRLVTIGGVITVDGMYYGLTVSHAFTDDAMLTEQEEVAEREPPLFEESEPQMYDSDWAYDSAEDSDGGESHADYGRSNVTDDSVLPTRIPDNETPDSASKSTSYKSILQDGSESASLDVMKISSLNPLRGFEANSFDGFDWALLELRDATFHCVNEVVLPQFSESHPNHLILKHISSLPPPDKVAAVTRRGVVNGLVTGSACFVKFGNSSVYRDVWSVQLEDIHEPGDSGSWIIDPISGNVHGVVIAGSRYLREVYAISAAEIFGDIGRKFCTVDVALPTVEETLCLASRHGNNGLIERLLQSHVDISTTPRGYTALQAAAECGHSVVVQSLLDAGVDVNAPAGFRKQTALYVAIERGRIGIVTMLLGAGASFRHEGWAELNTAVKGGDLEMVKMLLEVGVDIEYGKWRALNTAIREGHTEMVKILLDAGADIEYREPRALKVAAEGGHLEIVEMLLDAGADVHAGDGARAKTALDVAAEGGHVEVVKTLLDAGADVYAGGRFLKQKALKVAAEIRHRKRAREAHDGRALYPAVYRKGKQPTLQEEPPPFADRLQDTAAEASTGMAHVESEVANPRANPEHHPWYGQKVHNRFHTPYQFRAAEQVERPAHNRQRDAGRGDGDGELHRLSLNFRQT